MYAEDLTWIKAKQLAEEIGVSNNNIACLSIYRELGGQSIEVSCRVNNKAYFIYGILDSKNVLAVDENNAPQILNYASVEQSRKQYKYVNTKKCYCLTLNIPDNDKFYGKRTVTLCMRGGC